MFKLYVLFKKNQKANELALAIVHKESQEGKYKSTHALLQQIRSLFPQARTNYELNTRYTIYHSYILAKKLMSEKNHHYAGYLLNRVCDYISYFPKHQVRIMTTCVIECTKAKLRQFAYNWAIILC